MLPPSRDQIEHAIERACRDFGFPVEIAKRQCAVESSYQVNAHNSKSDCFGLFQLAAGTAEMLGVNREQWEDNVRGGVQYDRMMLTRFGELDRALAAYNWGPGHMRTCLKQHGDRWREFIPTETQRYIVKILGC